MAKPLTFEEACVWFVSTVHPLRHTECWETDKRHVTPPVVLGLTAQSTTLRRIAWALYRQSQPIPEGKSLFATCQNNLCVNPWHMRLSTAAENMAWRKMIERKVLEYVKAGYPESLMARRLGVPQRLVDRILAVRRV